MERVRMIRFGQFGIAALAVVALAGCVGEPADPKLPARAERKPQVEAPLEGQPRAEIVGSWLMAADKSTLVFEADGSLQAQTEATTLSGTTNSSRPGKWTADDKVISMRYNDRVGEIVKFEYTLSGDSLKLKRPGAETVLEYVKKQPGR